MFEIFLMSKKPIAVMIADKKILVSKDTQKKLEIVDAKKLDINYYFSSFSSNVFCVNLDFLSGEPKVFGEDVVLTRLEENRYILKFCKKNSCFLQKKCTKIAKNDLFFNFYQNGVVEIESENEVKFSENYDFQIFGAEVLELNGLCYALKLFGEKNQEKCIILNSSFAEILCFDSCVVEETENGFKVLTNLFDIAGHGLVEVFEIDEDIKKIDQYTVYMAGEARTDFNTSILPIYFLQCIKSGDYALAKRCLSVSLQSKVKIEHLKQYFGDFVDAYFFDDKIYLEYVQNSNLYTAKSFKFVVDGDVITDIS